MIYYCDTRKIKIFNKSHENTSRTLKNIFVSRKMRKIYKKKISEPFPEHSCRCAMIKKEKKNQSSILVNCGSSGPTSASAWAVWMEEEANEWRPRPTS